MRMDRRAGLLSGVSLAASLLAIPASAATFVVSDFGDSGAPGQLRSLINAAAAGDTILVPPATIVLTGAPGDNANASGDLDILKDLTIVGAGPELTVIDAGGVDRVFQIQTGVTVTISGLTLRHGSVDPASPVEPSDGDLLNRGPSPPWSTSWSRTTSRAAVAASPISPGAGLERMQGTEQQIHRHHGQRRRAHQLRQAGDHALHHQRQHHLRHVGEHGGRRHHQRRCGDDARQHRRRERRVGQPRRRPVPDAVAGPMTLVNVTIADNRVGTGNGFGFGGGLANASSASVTITNTLIARNETGPMGSGPDCTGTITSLGHNLVQSPAGCGMAAAAGDILGRSPGLQGFGDHGGPTETYSLRRRSLAIDAGDGVACGSSDQRGSGGPWTAMASARPSATSARSSSCRRLRASLRRPSLPAAGSAL